MFGIVCVGEGKLRTRLKKESHTGKLLLRHELEWEYQMVPVLMTRSSSLNTVCHILLRDSLTGLLMG